MGEAFPLEHVPFALPSRPYAISQEWRHLTFMHWEVDPKALQPHLPEGFEIDLYEGKTYIGAIPFMMEKVRPRGLPWVPGVSTFPEFNIRAYVVKDGKPGVFFLTLDAKSWVTCFYAPRAYGLAYRYAKAKIRVDDSTFTWFSKRKKDGAELKGVSTKKGPEMVAEKGSLEAFLFERYCLYSEHKGCLRRAYVHHNPWTYHDAEVTVERNTLLSSYNLGVDEHAPDHVHMADGLPVHTWSIEVAERIKPDDTRDFLYLDGDCGLCHRLATFIDNRLGKGNQLGYRPIMDEDAQRVIATLPGKMRDADSVYLIRKGKPYIHSAAGIRGLLYMRWYYKMWYPLFWLIPLPLRNIGYRFIARYRHLVFKRPTECLFRVD